MCFVDGQHTDLRIGQEIAGPAIVEERESTTVIGPGDRLSVNAFGCLVVDLAIPTMSSEDSDDVPVTIAVGGG